MGDNEVAIPGHHGSWMGTQVGVFDGSMSADESPGLLSMNGAGTCPEPAHPMVQPLLKGGTAGMPLRDGCRSVGSACQVNHLTQEQPCRLSAWHELLVVRRFGAPSAPG